MQILMAEAYDLLISDVMMPGLNSWEVLPKSLVASPVWDMNFASDTNATGRGMGYLLDIPA